MRNADYQILSLLKNQKQISLKRTTFAQNLRLRNGFKMWYSWASECGKINVV